MKQRNIISVFIVEVILAIIGLLTISFSSYYPNYNQKINLFKKQISLSSECDNLFLYINDLYCNDLIIKENQIRMLYIISGILILMTIGILISFNFYSKKLNDQLIHQRTEIIRSEEQKVKLRTIIYKHLDCSDKKSLIDSSTAIQRTVDKACDNFTLRLKAQFPHLKEEEILLCCLIKMGMDARDIAIRMDISKEYARKKKSRLKSSLGIIDRTIDLEAFLNDF